MAQTIFTPLCTLSAALLVLGASVAAQADTVLYGTSFESPSFTTGSIVGQDGWSIAGAGTPSSTIEDTFAESGSQAVMVSGSTNAQSGPYHVDISSDSIIVVSADLAIFSSSDPTEWQFTAISAANQFIGGIDVYPDGTIVAITNDFSTIGTFSKATTEDPSAWQDIALILNMANQTYDVSLDGVTLASDIPFCGGTASCTGDTVSAYGAGVFDTFGGGNDVGYMDNYQVSAETTSPVPEPSTLLCTSMGLAAIAAGLRRRLLSGRI